MFASALTAGHPLYCLQPDMSATCPLTTSMIQLRAFIHQRLHSVVEEILREVERTLTAALDEARLHRSAEHHSQREYLDPQDQIPEPPLTGQEVLQETSTQPSIQEEPHLSTPEVPVLSQTSADTGNSDGNTCLVQALLKISEIKEEREEIWDGGQTQQVIFPFIVSVRSEQAQPETQVSHESRQVSSDGSAAESSGEEWSRTKTERGKGKVLRRRNGSRKQEDPEASSASPMERSACPICGKDFKCIRPFIKHITRHRGKSESAKELLRHLQSALNKRLFCDVCGKKFTNSGSLLLHSKIHSGVKDFKCQDCGRAFVQKEQLAVHTRTHSGERPFQCRVCGRVFIQKQHLESHGGMHTGETP